MNLQEARIESENLIREYEFKFVQHLIKNYTPYEGLQVKIGMIAKIYHNYYVISEIKTKKMILTKLIKNDYNPSWELEQLHINNSFVFTYNTEILDLKQITLTKENFYLNVKMIYHEDIKEIFIIEKMYGL